MGAVITLICANQSIEVDGTPMNLYSARDVPAETPVGGKVTYAVLKESRIYTPGQGLVLEICDEPALTAILFHTNICYGSWYDIELMIDVITAEDGGDDRVVEMNYLKRGVYCSCSVESNVVDINEIITARNKLNRHKWTCACNHENCTIIPICKNCNTHNLSNVFQWLAIIPVAGTPFAVSSAVLSAGRANVTRSSGDTIEAALTILFSALDITLSPFILTRSICIITKFCINSGINSLHTLFKLFPIDRVISTIITDSKLLAMNSFRMAVATCKSIGLNHTHSTVSNHTYKK